MMHALQVKRIYEKPDTNDGYRILIDRFWPRGMGKDEVRLDDWAKSITPSTEIRKAFDHKPEQMDVFREKYISELNQNPAADEFLTLVAEKLRQSNVTLLYGAKNEMYNHAVILKDWITEKLP